MAIDLALVHAAVRRTRNTTLAAAILVLGVGGGMVAGAVAGDSHRVALAIIGGLFVLLAAVMLRMVASLWNPARSPVARLLDERPADVRWIYVEQIDSRVGGVTVKKTHAVKVADAADKLHTLMIANRDLDTLLTSLRAAAPSALYGYDEATIAAYRAQKVARRRVSGAGG